MHINDAAGTVDMEWGEALSPPVVVLLEAIRDALAGSYPVTPREVTRFHDRVVVVDAALDQLLDAAEPRPEVAAAYIRRRLAEINARASGGAGRRPG